MSYPIEFICHYEDLFRVKATLHIFQFYMFSSKETIDYIDFTNKLAKRAREIFYNQLSEGITEEKALEETLKIFKKKIVKP